MKSLLSRFLSGSSLAICVFAANAQEGEASGGRYYIAPMGSLAVSQRDDTHDVAVGGALAIGASWIPHFGFEIVGDYLRYTHLQHVGGVGLGANVYLSPDNQGVFVHADVEGGTRSMYNAGLGFDRPVSNGGVSLRLEALWHKEGDDDAEPLFRVGLRIPFGDARGPGPVTAQPVEVVPLDQTDSSSENDETPSGQDETQSEAFDAVEASPAPTEESSSTETQDAVPAAVVEPSPAPVSASTQRTAQQPDKTVVAPAKSQVAAPPAMAEPIPETPIQADIGSQAGDFSDDGEAAAAEPPEPAADDEALAPTEPAPAPRAAAAAPGPEAQDTAPAVQDQPAVSDDGLAPTEPAPKPR